MTVTDERSAVADAVAKVADVDEGSALTLLQYGFYEALCDEADRIRPRAEVEAAREILKRTEGAMERLAKRYATGDTAVRKDASDAADEVLALRGAAELVIKDYLEQHNVTQDDTGKFRRKGVRGAVLDLLGIGTKQGQGRDSRPEQTRGTLDSIVGEHADTYTRLRTLGQGLTAASGSTARGAGVAANIVGAVGPEAQRALEPGIRRTAYRYRGTEKRPNAALQRQARELAAAIRPPGEAGEGKDQDVLAALGNLGARVLWRQIPDVETARLSLEAGKMPPSVGIMFDADGNVVTEAMGFNGDHYLPFDLKNLKRLKGGSYVRTRTTGGPTDEDIYTALLSGARQIQVISNSGNFVIEFDPSLRGGRRYSDKARQMVDRYAKLVSTIGEGKVMQVPFPRDVMQQIERDAYEASGGDENLMREQIKEAMRAKQMELRFAEPDEDKLMKEAHTQALAEYKAKPAVGNASVLRRRNEIFQQKIREARGEQARAYRLDGEGYKAAMKALQTEFPYFIRTTDYEPLSRFVTRIPGAVEADEELPSRGGRDLGYTKPGELAPYLTPGGDRRDKDVRRGVKPLRGGGRPAAEPVAPQGEGEGEAEKPQGGERKGAVQPNLGFALAEHGAPSVDELVKSNRRQLTIGLAGSLHDALDLYKIVPDAAGAVPQDPDTGKVLDQDDALLTSSQVSPVSYLSWLTHPETFGGSTTKIAAFLGEPGHEAHRAKAREGLESALSAPGLSTQVKNEFGPKFEAAATRLGLLSGDSPFAEAVEDPVLAVPDESMRPQLFPQVAALGASLPNIERYAKTHPDVAALAAKIQEQGNEKTAEQIREQAETIERKLRWAADPKSKPAGVQGTLGQAMQFARTYNNHPDKRRLENLQLAWSLVTAADATASLKDVEPLRFADVGPKAAGPEEGAAKRFVPRPGTRVVLVDRDSPVAKALAARALHQRGR